MTTFRTGGSGPFSILSDIHLSMPSPSFTARYFPANNALDVFMDGSRIIMSRPVGMRSYRERLTTLLLEL